MNRTVYSLLVSTVASFAMLAVGVDAAEPKAKANPKGPSKDVMQSDKDLADEWLSKHALVSGWRTSAWKYVDEYSGFLSGAKFDYSKGHFVGGSPGRIYEMTFSPPIVLSDKPMFEHRFYVVGKKLVWPPSTHPANTETGVAPEVYDAIQAAVNKPMR